MSEQKYIGAKTSVWMFQFAFLIFLLIFILQTIYFFVSESSFSTFPFPLIGLLFFMKVNTISHDENNIYVTNFKGKKPYLRSADFSVEPIVFFLDFYWIKFFTTNEKYLFTRQIGTVFGTSDSSLTAKEIEKLLKK